MSEKRSTTLSKYIQKALFKVGERLPCRLINHPGRAPYLERYYISTVFGYTFYLHRFVTGDGDRKPHDHPWNAWSLVLTGWYLERVVTAFDLTHIRGYRSNSRMLKRGRFNRISSNKFHQIEKLRPNTWTLFCHGPREKGWGFLQINNYHDSSELAYRQPLDIDANLNWHLTAPYGRDIKRTRPAFSRKTNIFLSFLTSNATKVARR